MVRASKDRQATGKHAKNMRQKAKRKEEKRLPAGENL